MHKDVEKSRGDSIPFTQITTSKQLCSYLDSSDRLNNSEFLYHYTTVDNVVKMLRSKLWYLGNAELMNDMLEYKNGDKQVWGNLFFISFMGENKESIGMWSMYAQPWEKGVKISIPTTTIRSWLKSIHELQEISNEYYGPTGNKISIDADEAKLWISAVAYSNEDSLQGGKDTVKLSWSNKSNQQITSVLKAPELTGYIKDMAWLYEKEIRIKAQFNNYSQIKRIAIELTDDVIEQMIITASPLFDGNLQEHIENEIQQQMKIEHSIFKDRLNIKTICQNCSYKTQGTHY